MRKKYYKIAFCFFCCFYCLTSCSRGVDYYKLPSFSKTGIINAVIEIPAGTNIKYEYESNSKKFVIDKENGSDRVIDFLPYPANYGFIPSTVSDKKAGGDGDAIDVLLLAGSIRTGEVVNSIPIGILKLIDDGEEDFKIIAIPENDEQRVLDATNFDDFKKHYPAILEIIEIWFLNYNKNDSAVVNGWGDENEAIAEIQKASNK